MTETFTASNGVEIRESLGGTITFKGIGCEDFVKMEGYQVGSKLDEAMAEYYQNRRDEELRREREDSIIVHFHRWNNVDAVWVYDERQPWMGGQRFIRAQFPGTSGHFANYARAYFDAHPEPKPWHEAKDGEVWVLTIKNVDEAWTVKMGEFRDTDGLNIKMPLDNSLITAGRRIWPEEK